MKEYDQNAKITLVNLAVEICDGWREDDLREAGAECSRLESEQELFMENAKKAAMEKLENSRRGFRVTSPEYIKAHEIYNEDMAIARATYSKMYPVRPWDVYYKISCAINNERRNMRQYLRDNPPDYLVKYLDDRISEQEKYKKAKKELHAEYSEKLKTLSDAFEETIASIDEPIYSKIKEIGKSLVEDCRYAKRNISKKKK